MKYTAFKGRYCEHSNIVFLKKIDGQLTEGFSFTDELPNIYVGKVKGDKLTEQDYKKFLFFQSVEFYLQILDSVLHVVSSDKPTHPEKKLTSIRQFSTVIFNEFYTTIEKMKLSNIQDEIKEYIFSCLELESLDQEDQKAIMDSYDYFQFMDVINDTHLYDQVDNRFINFVRGKYIFEKKNKSVLEIETKKVIILKDIAKSILSQRSRDAAKVIFFQENDTELEQIFKLIEKDFPAYTSNEFSTSNWLKKVFLLKKVDFYWTIISAASKMGALTLKKPSNIEEKLQTINECCEKEFNKFYDILGKMLMTGITAKIRSFLTSYLGLDNNLFYNLEYKTVMDTIINAESMQKLTLEEKNNPYVRVVLSKYREKMESEDKLGREKWKAEAIIKIGSIILDNVTV